MKVGPRRPGSVRLVSRTPSSVKLRWTFPVGADRESLFRRDVTARTGWSKVYSELHSAGTTMTGLAAHRYEFRVQAAKGTAVATDIFSAPVLVDLRPLARPLVKPVPGHRVRITWQRAADTTRYQVRLRAVGGKWRTVGWTRSTALTSPRLVKGRRYAVKVVGWDSYGAGRTSVPARFRVR